ncbi:hypothetical protein FACS1894217_09870 [Clostridia bacterium]|nr:hypothetical protein FACS1894217_09870 [Clostridia bacterium]
MKDNKKLTGAVAIVVSGAALAICFVATCWVLIERAWSKFQVYVGFGVRAITEGKMLVPFIMLGVVIIVSVLIVAGIAYRAPHLGESGMRQRMNELEKTDRVIGK